LEASTNINGGTPGKRNAIDAANADVTAPQLLRLMPTDSVNIVVVFDEH